MFKKIALPELFPELTNVQAIQKLWDDFRQLYSVLQLECVSTDEVEKFIKDAKKWVGNFNDIYQSKLLPHTYTLWPCTYQNFYLNIKTLSYLHNKEWKS